MTAEKTSLNHEARMNRVRLMNRRCAGMLAMLMAVALAVQPVRAATADDAGKFIESLGTEALTVISKSSASREQKRERLEKLILSSIDVEWIGRFVLGRYWRTATPQQQKRYLKEYQAFLARQYTSRFADYSGGTFKITGTRKDADGEYMVDMEIYPPEQPPILVEYRLRDEKRGFRIFDVVVEGVSLITMQRSEFASVVGQNGLDYLIDQLASRAISSNES